MADTSMRRRCIGSWRAVASEATVLHIFYLCVIITTGGDDMDEIIGMILEIIFDIPPFDDVFEAPALLENRTSNDRVRHVIHIIAIIFRGTLMIALLAGLCALFRGYVKFGLICTLVPITYFVIYIIVHYINKRPG